jgi:hypothetical protein
MSGRPILIQPARRLEQPIVDGSFGSPLREGAGLLISIPKYRGYPDYPGHPGYPGSKGYSPYGSVLSAWLLVEVLRVPCAGRMLHAVGGRERVRDQFLSLRH